jgi:hypothetical protein
MASVHASRVEVCADIDYGEIYLTFEWPDPVYGNECLSIDADAHCSRRNSFYSGSGLDSLELRRDRLSVRFSETLAKKLMFHRDLEISFGISDDAYERLQGAVDFIVEVIAIRARQ